MAKRLAAEPSTLTKLVPNPKVAAGVGVVASAAVGEGAAAVAAGVAEIAAAVAEDDTDPLHDADIGQPGSGP